MIWLSRLVGRLLAIKLKRGSGNLPAEATGATRKRTDDTQASITNPEAGLYRKSDDTKLCLIGPGDGDRHGLVDTIG